jgi:hypothetical protein
MWIRYLASVDDTVYGRMALAYLRGLVLYAPVRLIPQTAPPSAAWDPYVTSLLAHPPRRHPLDSYVNIVCTAPERWTWMHAVTTQTRSGTTEVIRGRLELHTAGVHNVLIAATVPTDAHQIASAKRYETVMVQDEETAAAWRQLEIETFVAPTVSADDFARLYRRFTG